MEFLHSGIVDGFRNLEIPNRVLAAGVILGIVPGSAYVDSRIVTRALLRLDAAWRSLTRRRRGSRLLSETPVHSDYSQAHDQRKSIHPVNILTFSSFSTSAMPCFFVAVACRRCPQKNQAAHIGAAWFSKTSGEEGEVKSYRDGGVELAVPLCVLGVWAGVFPAPVLVISRMSTRRFFARPSAVLFDSTGLSLPRPIR